MSSEYIHKIRFYVIKCLSWAKDLGYSSFALLTDCAFSFGLSLLGELALPVVSSRSTLESIASAACPVTRIASASSEIRTTYEVHWQHTSCQSSHRWTWVIADGWRMYDILTLVTGLRSCTCILKPCRKDERLFCPVCSIKRYAGRLLTTVYLSGKKR